MTMTTACPECEGDRILLGRSCYACAGTGTRLGWELVERNRVGQTEKPKLYVVANVYLRVADITFIDTITPWDGECYVQSGRDGGFVPVADLAPTIFREWRR